MTYGRNITGEQEYDELLKLVYGLLEEPESVLLQERMDQEEYMKAIFEGIQIDRKENGFQTIAEHIQFNQSRFENQEKLFFGYDAKREKRKTYRRIAATLIGILVLSGSVYLAYQNYNDTPSESLIADYPEAFRVSQHMGDPAIPGYITAMDRNDWQSAFDELAPLAESGTSDLEIQFYLGICAYELGKVQTAIDKLKLTAETDSDNFLYSIPAHWYLGFAYLKADNQEKALITFVALKQRNRVTNHMKQDLEDIIKRLD